MKKSDQRFMQLSLQVFETPNGKELMEHLDEMPKAPVADPAVGSSFAYWREGQNNLIRRFKYAKDSIDNPRGEND